MYKKNSLAATYAHTIPGRPFRSPPAGLPRRTPQPRPADPQPLADADALIIAVRRSLESCRDTSQLRMLLALEGRHKVV